MIWSSYSQLEGKHAMLSPSKPAWLNYDDEKTLASYESFKAAQHGTELHALAAKMIKMGIRPQDDGSTFSMYVNDAINYRMRPEQQLLATELAFGTADAIIYRQNILRIHDLKTGLNETSWWQLRTYAAYFCIDYEKNPFNIDQIVLRIYQNQEIKEEVADPDVITHIMEKAKRDTKLLMELMREDAA